MNIESYDLIQQRQAETAAQIFKDQYPEGGNPHLLQDPSRRQEPLYGWQMKLYQTLDPSGYSVGLPQDAEWYNAMYTNQDAKIELSAEGREPLFAYVLRNKPVDMHSPLYTRLVVSADGSIDDSLVTRHPLLTTWAGPSGAFAAESPLLREEANPTAWQGIIAEALA